jgi:hypothetical protein
MHLDVAFNAGFLLIMTVGEPGTQGAAVTGTHGIGVKTPNAAAVAAATVGLAIDMHMPNVGMFFMGTKSMIVAAGRLPAVVIFSGVMISALGAMPNVHIIIALLATSGAGIFNPVG